MDWFEKITGFKELDYIATQSRLSVVDGHLESKHNRIRWAIGELDVPTLGSLRFDGSNLDPSPEPASFRCIAGDVRDLHRTAPQGALFQVASQFNLLEMIGPQVTPEEGVTRYEQDLTQGPACAIAAGAATIYRNYLMPLGDGVGQRVDRQVDCLRDLGDALGNGGGRLWQMRNGYPLCTEMGLEEIDGRLAQTSETERDRLRRLLRIGVHRGVQLTDGLLPRRLVSQAFCSALPVAYSNLPAARWASFAQLVLEAAYEATLRAAALYASDKRRTVYLTRLGGGAYGNDDRWINAAIRYAVLSVGLVEDLDIRLVCYRGVSAEMRRFGTSLNAELKQQWDAMVCDQ